MTPTEKEILQLLAKHAEMVNGQLADLLHRLKVAEKALQSDPQLLTAYQAAVKDTRRPELPGLPRQLAAVQQAIARIQD